MEFSEEKRNSLQGWLMRVLHKYTAVNYKRFLKLGVHPGQIPFIKLISENEGISQRELAEKLHVKAPTVAVTMKRLEKSEIICRRPDSDDLRVSRIYLAKKGKDISESILLAIEENEKALAAGFTEEELAQMQGYFMRMQANLERLQDESCDCGTKRERMTDEGKL